MLLAAKHVPQHPMKPVFSVLMITGQILLMVNAFVGGQLMKNLILKVFVATAMPLDVLLVWLDLIIFVCNVWILMPHWRMGCVIVQEIT